MQVIVSVAGFYGGTWYKAGTASVEMPEPIARQFLPPYGEQLAIAGSQPASTPATKQATKQASKPGGKAGKADA